MKDTLCSGILSPTMPAVQRSEFSLALNQVASERGVDVSVVLDTVKNAILAAYRKDHPGVEIEEYTAELSPITGEAKIFHEGKDITPPGFGRIAAQTAKQVILQKIREKEKEAVLSDYRIKIGGIVNGMVLRFAGPNVIIDIGKAEAILPVSEQIPNEKYHLNQRLVFFLLDIRQGPKGEEIVVSRSNNGLITGLFQREVPEVAQGSVEIKAVVREPGNRSKVAVFSSQPGIDPVGSCVGQKGVRVQAIIQELGGLEKIDIVQWSEDIKQYIAQSLSPAKNLRVEINEEEKVAHVFVPKDELSLAIGKEGQNVRLAYKLTQYRIEIEGNEEPEAEVAEDTSASSAQEAAEEPKEEAKAAKKAKKEEKAEEAAGEVSEEVKEEEFKAEVTEESGEVATEDASADSAQEKVEEAPAAAEEVEEKTE